MRINRRLTAMAAVAVLGAIVSVTSAQSPASADLSSDPRVRWLQKEAVKVRTVDPADVDFRDLQPLKKVIGDAHARQIAVDQVPP